MGSIIINIQAHTLTCTYNVQCQYWLITKIIPYLLTLLLLFPGDCIASTPAFGAVTGPNK